MFFTKPAPQDLMLRKSILENLAHLAFLFRARGVEIEFDPSAPTPKLEAVLWEYVDGLARRARLDFPPAMTCEERIRRIRLALPPMPRPGQSNGFLRDIATVFR